MCLCLLLRADMIVHECEMSIWRDERESALWLPALKPHTRVETHVIEKTGILSSKGTMMASELYIWTNTRVETDISMQRKTQSWEEINEP